MKDKISILGLGWLGIPLAKYFIEQGYIVNGTVRSLKSLENLANENFGVFQFDLNQSEYTLPIEIKNSEIGIICIPPGKSFEGNEYGIHLSQLIQKFENKTKFIFISSTSVYPETTKIATEASFKWEDHLNTMSFAEQQISLHLDKNRWSIVRMAGLIGPNRHPAKFFAGRLKIENGLAPVNLIHLVDCIQLIDLIVKKNYWGEIINGCSSVHPTREDYYTFACEKFNFDKPMFIPNDEGKVVSNEKSIQLGMKYRMNDPFEYWKF